MPYLHYIYTHIFKNKICIFFAKDLHFLFVSNPPFPWSPNNTSRTISYSKEEKKFRNQTSQLVLSLYNLKQISQDTFDESYNRCLNRLISLIWETSIMQWQYSRDLEIQILAIKLSERILRVLVDIC